MITITEYDDMSQHFLLSAAALEFVWSGERGKANDRSPPRQHGAAQFALLLAAALLLAGLLFAL